jgi:hypothetical protein
VNIFAVNDDPNLAARDLPDKLVVKMPTESIQLLTPWAFNAHNAITRKPDGTKYGTKGFAHHPCAKWLYESPSNVWWLLYHAISMTEEYERRYGKQHGVFYALDQLSYLILEKHGDYNWHTHTEFVQAMPDEFKVPGDPVTAYRNYINGYKGYAEWRYSEKPDWWDEATHEPIRKQYLAEREAKRMKRKHDKHSELQTSLQSQRGV